MMRPNTHPKSWRLHSSSISILSICLLTIGGLHGSTLPVASDASDSGKSLDTSRPEEDYTVRVNRASKPQDQGAQEISTSYQVRENPEYLRSSLEDTDDSHSPHGWRGFFSSTEKSQAQFRHLDHLTNPYSSHQSDHGFAGSDALTLIRGISSGVQSFARSLEGIYNLFQVFPDFRDNDPNKLPHYGNHHGTDSTGLSTLDQLDRRQCQVNPSLRFPCLDIRPTANNPTSIHELRPGDIKVIGAMGDHVISGTGALAHSITNAGEEFRGVSFASGGDGNWRQYLTIPNLLREFNPNLIGASTGSSGADSVRAGFNVADKSATSRNLKSQAKDLIRKIRASPTIDLYKDWKLIYILIGHGDLCGLTCARNESQVNGMITPEEFKGNVKEALDLLKEDLPNTFVALVQPINPLVFAEAINRPVACHLTAKLFCPCVFDHIAIAKSQVNDLVSEFRSSLKDLLSAGDYDDLEDFTVVLQPGLDDLSLPQTDQSFFGHKFVDLSYLAPNCVYPGQKLHAQMAKALWNNLLENLDYKSPWEPEARLRCPNPDEPYLGTFVNSKTPTRDEPVSGTPSESPFLRKKRRRKRKRFDKRAAQDLSCSYL